MRGRTISYRDAGAIGIELKCNGVPCAGGRVVFVPPVDGNCRGART